MCFSVWFCCVLLCFVCYGRRQQHHNEHKNKIENAHACEDDVDGEEVETEIEEVSQVDLISEAEPDDGEEL